MTSPSLRGASRFALLLGTPLIFASLARAGVATSPQPPSPDRAQAKGSNSPTLPVFFMENAGATNPEVRFTALAGGQPVFFTPGGVTFRLAGTQSWAVKVEFPGAASGVVPIAEDAAGVTVSHFQDGARPVGSRLRSWNQVTYPNLWPGIDLVYRAGASRLKYELVVHPGADPSRIRLRYQGVTTLRTDADGSLVAETPAGDLRDAAPVSWQDGPAGRAPVTSSYSVRDDGGEQGTKEVAFSLGAYDHSRTLIIDPAVQVYGTYLGSASQDYGTGMAIDSAGSAYVTGNSWVMDYPRDPGALGDPSTGQTAFVAKLDPRGRTLEYLAFLGGSQSEDAYGITVDSTGSAYVVGRTDSADFPVTDGAFDTTINSPSPLYDGFLTKLNPAGTALVYSTFLGGAVEEHAAAVAVNPDGEAFVLSNTTSRNFPTTADAYSPTYHGEFQFGDIGLTRFSADGSTLQYSTYFGGQDTEFFAPRLVERDGSLYVTGVTASDDYPVTPGAFDPIFERYKGFLFQLDTNQDGTDGLVFSTFFPAGPQSVAVGEDGRVYLTGIANGNLPVTPGAFDPLPDTGFSGDAFVACLEPTGASLVYATYLGGSGEDEGADLHVNGAGNVTVVGHTAALDFPVTLKALQATSGGSDDAFVSVLNPIGTGLVSSTYLGGAGRDFALRVARDERGAVYVMGETDSTNFPTTEGALDRVLGNGDLAFPDVWVSKFSLTPRPDNPTQLKASAVSGHQVRLTWQDDNPDEIGFQIERRTEDGAFEEVMLTGPNLTTYTDRTVTPDTRYTYRVRAVSDGGDSVPSNEASLTTPAAGALVVLPGAVQFKVTRVGKTSQKQVKIINRGRGPLVVSLGSLAAPFSVVGSTTNEIVLGKAKKRIVKLRFQPEALGTVTSAWEIRSDDPARPLVTVPLQGAAPGIR